LVQLAPETPVALTSLPGFDLICGVDETENILEPLPYHVELRDYLKSLERELWNWFASARAQADYTESLRMELLKSTYRLDAESHPELYEGVAAAKSRLQLDIPVTVYQAQNSPQPNAALYFISGEGHVVFSGPLQQLPAKMPASSGEKITQPAGRLTAIFHQSMRIFEFKIAHPLEV
jgi:hypothetical protein